LLVTGLLGAFGSVLLYYFAPPLGIVGASPTTNAFITGVVTEVIPPAIPTLAALVFAGLGLRANQRA